MRPLVPPSSDVRKVHVRGLLGPVVVLVLGALAFVYINRHMPTEKTTIKPEVRPVEFLYLDGPRVLTYLEEIQGGAVNSEEESHKVASALNAKLQLGDDFEAGESSQEENLIQRSMTPTAASLYSELFKDLKKGHEIKRIPQWSERGSLDDLKEGQIVLFTTEALRPPIYIAPYLAARQRRTLSTLFPRPIEGKARQRMVMAKRSAARLFSKQIGPDPHMIFSLRRSDNPQQMQYLLPLSYRSFNSEDSLLSGGGGSLTILGKVERILPEATQGKKPAAGNEPAYVDSATRQTWRRPLRLAPGELLCRSSPLCESEVAKNGRGKSAVEAATRHVREAMERALTAQTEVEENGAVVVPIAIYK